MSTSTLLTIGPGVGPVLLAAADFDASTLGRALVHVLCLIMCVAVHEFGHAYVADRLGDPLPRAQGRVTLNPLAHIDWMGTVLIPIVMAVNSMTIGARLPLIGWGKPVQWSGNPRFLTRRFSMRTIRLMVSVAGPAMNLMLALLLSVLVVVLARLHLGLGLLELLVELILMNLGLMYFNLLPVPPLDGRTFLEFLPRGLAPIRDVLTQYGGYIFLALVLLQTPLRWLMLPMRWFSGWYLHVLSQLAG